MYLHLGQHTAVRTREILGIFDLDTATLSKHTRNYLARAEKAGQVVNVTEELPKAFVVCSGKEGNRRIYISQISTVTLLKRSKYIHTLAGV